MMTLHSRYSTVITKYFVLLFVCHLVLQTAWVIYSQGAGLFYARLYVERMGEGLAAACFNSGVLSVGSKLNGSIVTYLGNDFWWIKDNEKAILICRSMHLNNTRMLKSMFSSTFFLGLSSFIKIHYASTNSLRAYWLIGIISQRDLSLTLVPIAIVLAASYILINHRDEGRKRNSILGLFLVGIALVFLLVSSALVAIAIVAGDIPLYFLSLIVPSVVASLLVLAALYMLRLKNRLHYEIVTITASALVLMYLYYAISIGPSIIHAVEGVLALTRVNRVEAVLVAPAYYPLTATLVLLLSVIGLMRVNSVSQPLVENPLLVCTLLAATIVLYSVAPVQLLSLARIAVTILIVGFCIANDLRDNMR